MKKITILLLWVLTYCTSMLQAQRIADYQFSASQGTFVPLTNATTLPGFKGYEVYGNDFPIGFSFKYGGKLYDKFAISSNGFMALGQGSTNLTTSANVNNLRDGLSTNRPIIAPFWDDLNMTDGLVSYKTEGIVGDRILTVEWSNANWSIRYDLSFQVKLYETSGKIEFIYRREAVYNLIIDLLDASIGITDENTGIRNFLSLQNVTSSPFVSSVVEQNDISTQPATGQIYAFAPQPPVLVTSINPTQGTVGTAVTIQGRGFSTTASNNKVKFNGTVAAVTSATTTEIRTLVPAGATTGRVSVEFNNKVGFSGVFTVTPSINPPQITSFTPNNGLVGTNVTISGANFSTTATNNIVKFNGTRAAVTSATTNEIRTSVPTGASTGKITVEVNGKTTTSGTNFTVISPASNPQITSFTPSSGSNGTNVTISGANFSTTAANNTVKFNGTVATVTSATTNEIRTSVPNGASTGKITVEVNGKIATSGANFTVVSSTTKTPRINSFTPASGLAGTNVTISGANFSTTAANNTVKFNGTVATVTSATTNEIRTSVPTGATTGRITVEVNGKTATSLDHFVVGTSPILEMTEQTTNGSASIGPKLAFGILHSSSSVTRTITIENKGRSNLELRNLKISGTGFAIDGTAPTTVAPGSSKNLTLRYTYSENRDGTLEFQTNDPANRSEKIRLSGFLLPSFTAATGRFTPLTGATNANISADSDVAKGQNIGFTFSYLGQNYDRFDVASNGYLILANASSSTFSFALSSNNLFRITGVGEPFIAPLWDDLDMSSGKVSYKTEGPAGNQVLTVEWLNAEWGYQANTATISFQAKLYQASGRIEFIYRQEADSLSDPSASIGITHPNHGNTNFLSLNNTSDAPSVSHTSENRNLNAKPATGQVYAFTPVVPVRITDISPAQGKVGARITITGNNFNFGTANNIVKFNGITATITSATATEIQATIPSGATTGKITVEANNLTATSSDDFNVVIPPTITSFTPTEALEGANVIITGTNFSAIASNNTVKFNGTKATIISATTTEIKVTVPSGATTGKITVEVYGETATSANNFTVLFGPTITSFTPTQGEVRSNVTIKGTNFSTTAANNTVKFNGVVATVTSATTTEIKTMVPVGATTGKITVEVNGATATSTDDFKVTLSVNAPQITSFTPAQGSEGTSVTITGSNFSTATNNNTVKFNGTKATITSATTTEIKTTVPVGATTGKITVEVNGETATSATNFTVTSSSPTAPTITSFTPGFGSEGTSVTITGTNFGSFITDNVVRFNGTLATVISSTPTEIKTSVPFGATTGKITVDVAFEQAISTTDFIVTSSSPTAPTITSFTPTRALVGTTVIITGTNFSSNPLANFVKFNGIPGIILAATPTQIQTVVPLGATTGRITVEVDFKTAISATDFIVSNSAVTALPQTLPEAKLRLFPNPFVDHLTMEIEGKTGSHQVKIVVVDQQGKAILTTKQTLVNGRLVLPLKGLQSGKYLLKMRFNEGTVLRRIIKL